MNSPNTRTSRMTHHTHKAKKPHMICQSSTNNEMNASKRPLPTSCTQQYAKRRRTTCTGHDATPNSASTDVLLNNDLVSIILSFMDTKTQFVMSKTTKSFAQLVSHEHVVRSGAYGGMTMRRNLEHMIRLIESRKIWTPSPLRLLRILNAKRCERCCGRGKASLSKDFGVFFCLGKCLFNKECTLTVSDRDKAPVPRITNPLFRRFLIWKQPYRDLSGELCGPVLSVLDVDPKHSETCIESKLADYERSDLPLSRRNALTQLFHQHHEAGQRRACIEYLRQKRLCY